jgi:hypothetical protein
MTQQEELRLPQFRSDLLKILGEIHAELSALRKAVLECGVAESRLAEIRREAKAVKDRREDNLAQRLGPL